MSAAEVFSLCGTRIRRRCQSQGKRSSSECTRAVCYSAHTRLNGYGIKGGRVAGLKNEQRPPGLTHTASMKFTVDGRVA